MTITQKSNTGALIGAGLVTVVVFILTALLQFFSSQTPWPETIQGWLVIVVPALCAGALAALTPYYQRAKP